MFTMIQKIVSFIVCLYSLSIAIEGIASPAQTKETLTYKISYFYLIPFGTASLTIEEQTTKPEDVNVKYNLTVLPYRFIHFFSNLKASLSAEKKKDIVLYQEDIESQMSRTEHNTIIYNHKENIMEFPRGQFQGLRKKVNPDTLDPFSLFPILRNSPFKKGDTLRLVLNSHQSNYILKGVVQDETEKTWKIHFTMQREDKQDKKPKLTLDIWIKKPLHGEKATPTLFKAKTLIGPFTIKLVSAS